MDIQTLCREIQMPEPMVQQLLSVLDELNMDHPAVQRLMNPETGLQAYGELCQLLGDDPIGARQLACQLHCACLRRDTYRQLGIPDDIYFATMSCYTRFVNECLYYKGGYQFDRGWWTWRQLSMVAFRLGRLEFELHPEGHIAMHIPSGSELDPEVVDEALSLASDFLARFYPERVGCRFTCNSWLLSPALSGLLPTGSNILSFQKRFRLFGSAPEAQDYISWLFRCLPGTPLEHLPEETSLQKKAKQFLLNGGKIGNAAGELIR